MMSDLHEQAMNYVYQQVLQRLLGHLSRAERTALQLLIQRLLVAAGGAERISDFVLLVPFGGGKDSAYTLALLRAAQLSICTRAPGTFKLRVATLRHAGLSPAVMGNIHRVYSALFLYDDPRVEMLVFDDQRTHAFEPDLPFSAAGRRQNRADMLRAGHLTAGDGRSTFCDSCHLNLADAFYRAMTWGEGVGAVATGDSRKEQKQYITWLMRLAQATGQQNGHWRHQSFQAVMRSLGSLTQAWRQELYGEAEAAKPLGLPAGKAVMPVHVAVGELFNGRADEHWDLLTDFLGFRFDDLALAFSESDCANPLLMAHLQGLRSQYLDGGRYADGIASYLQDARRLMRRKRMPARLVAQVMAAFDGDACIQAQRALAAGFAQQAYGLNEAQLVCMLYSPFVDQGQGMERYLRDCHPGMLVALPDLHRALSGQQVPEQVLQWLMESSAMSLAELQALYARRRIDLASSDSIIARIRAADPERSLQRRAVA